MGAGLDPAAFLFRPLDRQFARWPTAIDNRGRPRPSLAGSGTRFRDQPVIGLVQLRLIAEHLANGALNVYDKDTWERSNRAGSRIRRICP